MINYKTEVVKYSSLFAVIQIIQVFFFLLQDKKIVGVSCTTDHAQLYLLTTQNTHVMISFSTTVAVMVTMEPARLLFSASGIIGNVR